MVALPLYRTLHLLLNTKICAAPQQKGASSEQPRSEPDLGGWGNKPRHQRSEVTPKEPKKPEILADNISGWGHPQDTAYGSKATHPVQDQSDKDITKADQSPVDLEGALSDVRQTHSGEGSPEGRKLDKYDFETQASEGDKKVGGDFGESMKDGTSHTEGKQESHQDEPGIEHQGLVPSSRPYSPLSSQKPAQSGSQEAKDEQIPVRNSGETSKKGASSPNRAPYQPVSLTSPRQNPLYEPSITKDELLLRNEKKISGVAPVQDVTAETEYSFKAKTKPDESKFEEAQKGLDTGVSPLQTSTADPEVQSSESSKASGTSKSPAEPEENPNVGLQASAAGGSASTPIKSARSLPLHSEENKRSSEDLPLHLSGLDLASHQPPSTGRPSWSLSLFPRMFETCLH